MSAEQDRKSDLDEAYSQAWTAWGNWQSHARDDLYAIVDNTWTKEDIAYMKKVMPAREIMSFPLLRRFVRLISNFERNNRTSLRYDPVENSDEMTANQYTLIANDALARGRGYHIKSDCFDHALKSGMALFNIAMDRQHQIHFEKFGYNQFILHPGFSRRDLADCQYGVLRKYITPSEAKMFFADSDDYIDWLLIHENEEDEKFPNMPRVKLYGQYLLSLDEWTRRTVANKQFFVDSRVGYLRDKDGNKVEYTDTPEERMALATEPTLDLVTEPVRTVEVTQYLNGKEVYHGVDPFGIGDFSFTPYMAFFDPEVDHFHLRIQSAVRALKDSQRAFDRRTIANIRALECVIGAGLDVEEGALVDDRQAYTAGAGHPRFFKQGAIAEQRFRDRPSPNLPAGYLQMQEVFDKLPGKILNLNEDGLLGIDQKDQLLLGVVGKMRLGLGMVGMFDFFDNKSFADQVMGGKLLKLIQQMPPDKVMRILGEEVSPAFYNKEFMRYDAVPCETTLTDTQRNALYTEMLNLKKMGAEIGDPFPVSWSDLLQFAPTAMKRSVLQSLAAKEQQQQQAAQRAQQLQEAVQMAALKQMDVDTRNEEVHLGERAADLMQTKVNTAQTLQEMQTQPRLDMLDRAIEMEKIKAQPKKADIAKGNNG